MTSTISRGAQRASSSWRPRPERGRLLARYVPPGVIVDERALGPAAGCGPVASGKTPYIRFDLNDYSIPHHLVGKPLTLVASETLIRITNSGGHVFASHARSYDHKQVIEDPEHIAELAREKRRARELRGRDRLRSTCPNADAFVEALALRGENLGGHVSRLLTLLDRYGASEVELALKDTLGRGAIGAASVAHVLDQRARARKAPPALDVVLPDDPRVRDLRVTPHALDTYDALCKPKESV